MPDKLSSRFKTKKDTEKKTPEKFSFAKRKPDAADETPDIKEMPDIADLTNALADKIDSIPVWFEYSEESQKELIKNFVENKLSNSAVTNEDKNVLIEKLYKSVAGFGVLGYLLGQENVSSVFVNGTNSVHIEIGGRILNTEMKLNEKQLNFIIRNISFLTGVKIDNSNDIWNLKTKDFYISVIMPEISMNGINLSIRKAVEYDINDVLNKGMLSKEIFDFLISVINDKKNIIISGDINSGKTTLFNILIKSALLSKRVVLLEYNQHIDINSDTLMKFKFDKKSENYYLLMSNILQLMPDYILSDTNEPIAEISDASGVISTLRAESVEAAMTKLISAFVSGQNLPEKFAKAKVLTNYDYIVQINNMPDGIKRITSVVKLAHARTAALSLKVIAKYVDGQYISEIPQPLTSFRAGTLIAQAGSMTARFQK